MDNLEQSIINVKVPKKILHFSDGTLEVYEEDEDDRQPEPEPELIEVNKDEG
jgi:hypothetical protein